MKYSFDIKAVNEIKEVLVTSCWRGFWGNCYYMFADDNVRLYGLRQMVRKDGRWEYEGKLRFVEQSKHDAKVALTGSEPWRMYNLNADAVGQNIDEGIHPDAIRGFNNRHEPWQPFSIENYASNDEIFKTWLVQSPELLVDNINEATVFEREDGWRVWQKPNGRWAADHHSISCVGVGDHHFKALRGAWATGVEAMAAVDKNRPWA